MSQFAGEREQEGRLEMAQQPREAQETNGAAQAAGAPAASTEAQVEGATNPEVAAPGSTEAVVSQAGGEAQDAAQSAGREASSQPLDEQYAETFRVLNPGEIIQGKVVQVGADEVLVDVGYKSEGRIPLNELGLRSGQVPSDVVKEGDIIDVQVLKVEDAEGNVLLSRKRAQYRQAWKELEELYAKGEPLEAVVTERVKGGLLVDVGVRGFLPASHVERNFVENLDQYVGKKLRMKILELDRQRNNVVLSRKELLEEEYEKAKAETFARLREGDIVQGVVKRITDFGAFVDIGSGVEGLLHVSELAWSRVRHPSDVLSEGQEIKVKVLNVDRENERISLSLKETLPDPWENIEERYQVGDILRGTVTRVVDFGAFVKVEDGVEGLVHISQMADHHVNNPNEVVSPGSEVTVKVVSLDPQARRIGLSIKEANRKPKAPKESKPADEPEVYRSGPEGQSGDTVTLGEVHSGLSDLFQKMEAEERKE